MDIILQWGSVLQLGVNLTTPEGAKVIDASGKHVTPGLIDMHRYAQTANFSIVC